MNDQRTNLGFVFLVERFFQGKCDSCEAEGEVAEIMEKEFPAGEMIVTKLCQTCAGCMMEAMAESMAETVRKEFGFEQQSSS